MDRRNRILSGFLAVAGLIGILELRTPAEQDPRTVTISPEFRQFVQNQLRASGRSEVSAEAIDKAVAQAIEEEILYREGLSLGLEQDDLIIKRRIVQKMRFMVEAATPLLEPTREQLESYLAQNAERFQTAESLQIEHVFFSRGRRGDRAMLDASELLQKVSATPAQAAAFSSDHSDPRATGGKTQANDLSASEHGDAHPLSGGVRTITGAQLTRELGSQLAAEVMSLPVGQWSQPIPSGMGVHLVRAVSIDHSRVMSVEEAGSRLVAEVKEHQRERMNEAATQAIMSRYSVESSK